MFVGAKPSGSSQSHILKELEQNPIELHPDVWEFLSSNHYLIFRDSGYYGLDQLIDDNPETFQSNFEQTVRKSLSLIFYTDGAHKLSTRKSRLKEQLFKVFEGTKQLITRLTRDHLLLLKVYTTFFQYRVKLFTKEETRITSQLFGDKDSENHVKVLFDSFMFYILKKQEWENSPETLSPEDRSPSPVMFQSNPTSFSQDSTLRFLRDEISFYEPENGSRRFRPRRTRKPQTNLSQDSNLLYSSKCSPQQELSNILINDQSDSHNRLPEKYMKILQGIDDSDATANRKKWISICSHLKQRSHPTSNVNSQYRSTSKNKNEYGILESYSASRHCGFITTLAELQVIVVRDELAKAGLSDQILSSSVDDIRVNVQFSLQEIASEPVPVFEAIDLMFVN